MVQHKDLIVSSAIFMFFTEKITPHYVASPPTTSTCSITYGTFIQYMCKLLWKSLFHPWEDTIGRSVCTPLSTHFVRHAQNAQKRRKLISFGSKVTRLFICLAFLPVGFVAPASELRFVHTQRAKAKTNAKENPDATPFGILLTNSFDIHLAKPKFQYSTHILECCTLIVSIANFGLSWVRDVGKKP